MSHIVKQTISVRSGNGVEDSFIFMIQRYVRLSQRCFFPFARFSPISYEIVRNPSFGIKIRAGIVVALAASYAHNCGLKSS